MAAGTEGEINGIVKEYLEYTGLTDTASTFLKECQDLNKPLVPQQNRKSRPRTGSAASRDSASPRTKLLTAFHEGQVEKFLEQWRMHVPIVRAENDSGIQKLEFYLHLYFAVWDIKSLKAEAGESDRGSSASSRSSLYSSCPGMSRYKNFLESPAAAALSQTPEFLPLYALPYVADPMRHPSYSDLFTEKWSASLRSRLEKFLQAEPLGSARPRLLEMFGKSEGDGRSYCLTGSGDREVNGSRHLEQKLSDAERKASDYGRRFTKVQAEYQNLINITASLVDTLELCIQGQSVKPEFMEGICSQLFDDRVRQTTDFSRPGTAGKALRQSLLSNAVTSPTAGIPVVSQSNLTSNHLPITCLDFKKISRELSDFAQTDIDSSASGERRKCLLLQALRWNLTKVSPEERDTALDLYITEDILGCKRAGALRQSIIEMLESDRSSEELKQSVARLLNCLASLHRGRSYLALNSPLILCLISYLKREDNNANSTGLTVVRDQLLGCLQKLSLKKDLQLVMINEQLVVFLVDFLSAMDLPSSEEVETEGSDPDRYDYMLEYAVALLMNLCLRSAGKRQCVPIAEKTLKLLSSLLTHPNIEIIPYANGALYSVLCVPEICEVACGPEVDIENRLTTVLATDQRDTRRQLEYILKLIRSHSSDPGGRSDDLAASDDDDDNDDEEDQDEMEADLDTEDVVHVTSRELHGNALLAAQYSLPANVLRQQQQQRVSRKPAAQKKQDVVSRAGDNTSVKDSETDHQVLRRPVTPGAQRKLTLTARVAKDTSLPELTPPPSAGAAVMQRPPTRSGSRPNSSMGSARSSRTSALGDESGIKRRPTADARMNIAFSDPEYAAAFSTKPRVLRTPDLGGGKIPLLRRSVPQQEMGSDDEAETSSGEARSRDNGGKKMYSTMPAQSRSRLGSNSAASSVNSDILTL